MLEAARELPILPSERFRELDFDVQLTSFAVNLRGTLVAMGFSNGRVTVCDSMTFGNTHSYEGHTHAVSSLSFRRDSVFIVSGDVSGLVLVHDSVTKKTEYSCKFKDRVAQIDFGRRDLQKVVVVLGNHEFYVISLTTSSMSCYCASIMSFDWGWNGNIMYGMQLKSVSVFRVDDAQRRKEIDVECDSEFVGIRSLQQGNMFMLICDDGQLRLYNKDGDKIATYSSDTMNFTTACFWMDKSHIFASSNQIKSGDGAFVAFVIGGSTKAVLDVRSSRVPFVEMTANPKRPFLYIRAEKMLTMWAPPTDWLIPSCHVGQQMIVNEEYVEKEDEWDISTCFPAGGAPIIYRQSLFMEEEEGRESNDMLQGEILDIPCSW